jgi:hypothetical protein
MLALLKNLFSSKSKDQVVEVKSVSTVAVVPPSTVVEDKTTLEFHEEIKQQVAAEKSFPVKTKKPATKKSPAKIKAVAQPASKKSKKQ